MEIGTIRCLLVTVWIFHHLTCTWSLTEMSYLHWCCTLHTPKSMLSECTQLWNSYVFYHCYGFSHFTRYQNIGRLWTLWLKISEDKLRIYYFKLDTTSSNRRYLILLPHYEVQLVELDVGWVRMSHCIQIQIILTDHVHIPAHVLIGAHVKASSNNYALIRVICRSSIWCSSRRRNTM